MKLSHEQQTQTESVIEKLTEAVKNGALSPVSSLEDITGLLSRREHALLLELFPGLEDKKCAGKAEAAFTALKTQRLNKDGEPYTHTVYVPKPVWGAFQKMNTALQEEAGKELLVMSAYRSCAYQASVFLYHLRKNGYAWDKTADFVALPGKSEHTDPEHTALDLSTPEIENMRQGLDPVSGRTPAKDGGPKGRGAATANGIDPAQSRARNVSAASSGIDFSETKEYAWLQKNAPRYGFELSYPKGNNKGKAFEPWHWRYTP